MEGGAALSVSLARAFARALLLLAPIATAAQELPLGAGEEVPYVPTPQNVVDAMLKIAGVSGADFVIDLGSGDGRIVIAAAAKYGARGLGVDYDGYLVKESQATAAKAGVADRVTFLQQDIKQIDFSPATVLMMYLLPAFNLELRPKILAELRPGARVVSHDWDMGDWEPDAKIEISAPEKTVGLQKSSTVYCWIVPARVAGRWHAHLPLGDRVTRVDLEFMQRFQHLTGTATVDGVKAVVERANVRGPFVQFRFAQSDGEVRFEGHLRGDRIVGRVTTPDGRTHPWRALREH